MCDQPRALDQDLNQGSFLVLPLLGLVVALAYNYKTVSRHTVLFLSIEADAQYSRLRAIVSPSVPMRHLYWFSSSSENL